MISEPKTYTLYHYIGGQTVAGESERYGDVYDPSTGQVTKHVPLATRGDVEQAIAAAEAAFPDWAATPPAKRARYCSPFATSFARTWTSSPGSCPASTARPWKTPRAP
jgi:malonate-semialdehyde dehydrogenase (acetylating) / methylmalonate-semialdehyde dehydrogenase